MRISKTPLLLAFVVAAGAHAQEKKPFTPAPAARIRINSIGFSPDAIKRATVPASVTQFRVIAITGATEAEVFHADAMPAGHTAATDTDEDLRVLDFSALETPGKYVLEVPPLGRSAEFTVSNTVWNVPFHLVTRAMYLWRCGTEVSGEWGGVRYHQNACHLEDGWLDHIHGRHEQRRSTGGWHDAGDYNKYVVNAGVTVGLMLKAFEHFPGRIGGVNLGIPESNNQTPDLLDEVRWELEWLFTMQGEDGRVYHKLSALNFKYWGPAENDSSPRYFVPWGTTATADFTAMMACAARVFRPYDAAFAARCLKAAELSWACLEPHPGQVTPDQSAFKTGGYDSSDESPRLWAAAELWETTGDKKFLQALETRAVKTHFAEMGPGWGDVQDLGLGTYLLSKQVTPDNDPRDAALVRRLTGELLTRANEIASVADENLHGRPFAGERKHWSWGCNGSVAGIAFQLQVADRLAPNPRYRQAAQLSLGHLFGRNYHGRSYVTGLGHQPPRHPHDRRGEPAWPGYLVGGPWPDARGWVDDKGSYERNEIAINWNGALIYALAAFVEPEER